MKICNQGFLLVCLIFSFLKGSPVIGNDRADSIRTELGSGVSDTAAIRLLTQLAGEFEISKRNQPDSTLFYLNKALALTEKTGNSKHLYTIYEKFSKVFSGSGNYSFALDYYFKMLSILDDEASGAFDTISLNRKYAGLYADIASCYFNMDGDKALAYYQKSLEVVKKLAAVDKDYPSEIKLMLLYANIGSANLITYNYGEAEINFEKALEMNKSIQNPAYDGSIYNNLGIIYKEKKDFEKAFRYYNKSLEIRLDLKDTAAIAQTYNNLGDCYFLVGEYKTAVDVLKKAIEMSVQTNSIWSQMKAANFLSLAYEKIGDYDRALEMNKLFKTLNDSIISSEQMQNIARLELQYQYEKQRKENELQQEIIVAKKERKALIYMIISGVLLFSIAILFLLNRNQGMKMKQAKLIQEGLELERKNLTLEKQNLQMEKQNLELELEFRNKELSTHVMYLLRKNEFISSIINKLLMLKKSGDNTGNYGWMQDILREMQSNIDNTVWSEFEKRFQQVHQDFYQKLLEKYPVLSPNEIKICAFLKLNMTTKDISAITFQSVKSIQVARNRLRKKMGIERDENLVSSLQQL